MENLTNKFKQKLIKKEKNHCKLKNKLYYRVTKLSKNKRICLVL